MTIHIEIAEKIMGKYTMMYCNGDFYKYKDGAFSTIDDVWLKQLSRRLMLDKFSRTKGAEVINTIMADCYTQSKKVNQTELLNLKNGMFDLKTHEMKPHNADYKSTIQLAVKYSIDSLCEKWLKTLDQIFEGDIEKISILQEFFGLCFTKEVKYEKALICVGEGRNGKSVILYILEEIIGRANRSAVSLEKFDNPHYISNLFGKLVNISIETAAKSSVYDANFKSIVSGDSIEADPKYKKPFMFRPFSKLVISTNNMPRVDDKSIAFFRRLIILRFNKQFEGKSQNRNLRHELKDEIDGIFLWALMGLRRLEKQKGFTQSASVLREIADYKKENNNVLIFIDEECAVDGISDIGVTEFYDKYVSWCKKSGHKSLSQIKFGKELMNNFAKVSKRRTNQYKYYHGVRLGFSDQTLFESEHKS